MFKWRMSGRLPVHSLCLVAALLAADAAEAAGTNLTFVSNEKSSTITVLDQTDTVVSTFKTCSRPRGIGFSKDHLQLYVACGDDQQIGIYDVATQKLVRRIRDVPYPETYFLHPDGKRILISNEEDSEATIYDVTTGERIAEMPTGPEPEGVLIAPDGKRGYVTSEAANLVHVIDMDAQKVIKTIVTDTRPRRFAMTKDQRQLWVSAEIAGVIDIIDATELKMIDSIKFSFPGQGHEAVTPVDVIMNRDTTKAYVALGRANRVAVVDVATRQVTDYILVGKRPWGLRLNADESKLYVANGLSDDLSIINTKTNKVLKTVPVGEVPYGIVVDDR